MKNLKFLNLSHYCVTRDGKVYSIRSERFLKLQSKGYQMVGLTKDDGTKANYYVHRLVAAAFCEGYEECLQVNHLDGNKSNNYYKNLEWVTRSENMIHAFRNGLVGKEIDNFMMTEEVVHKICRLLEQGARPIDVAEMFGVTPFNVQDILEKKSFKYISEEYNFSKVKRKFRLSEDKVLFIVRLLQEGKSNTEISKITKVKLVTIRRIKKRETFNYLTDQFSW